MHEGNFFYSMSQLLTSNREIINRFDIIVRYIYFLVLVEEYFILAYFDL